MIVVTGGNGFIGSNLVNALCNKGLKVIVCDYRKVFNKEYISKPGNIKFIEPKNLFEYISKKEISAIFHLGAISSTTSSDGNKIWMSNIYYSNYLWKCCVEKNIRIIYASSAATYGNGEYGFEDNLSLENLKSFRPLNIYGWSKKQLHED